MDALTAGLIVLIVVFFALIAYKISRDRSSSSSSGPGGKSSNTSEINKV